MGGNQNASDTLVQVVCFELADRSFGFSLPDVSEILPIVALTPVPGAPPWLPGVIDLRGHTLPVIDLRTRLALPAAELNLDAAIIVAATRTGEPIGFIVDRVLDIARIPSGSIDPADTFGGTDHPVQAVSRTAGRVTLILDVNRLAADLRSLALPDEIA